MPRRRHSPWRQRSSFLSSPPLPGARCCTPPLRKGGGQAPAALKALVNWCPLPVDMGKGGGVGIEDMLTGGSGLWNVVVGMTDETKTGRCKYVVNCTDSSSKGMGTAGLLYSVVDLFLMIWRRGATWASGLTDVPSLQSAPTLRAGGDLEGEALLER